MNNSLKVKILAIFIIVSIGLVSSAYNIYSTRTPTHKVKQ